MKYDKNHALIQSEIPGLPPPRRGKVRDLYDLGDNLLLVATDRISAFDVVMLCHATQEGVLAIACQEWLDGVARGLQSARSESVDAHSARSTPRREVLRQSNQAMLVELVVRRR